MTSTHATKFTPAILTTAVLTILTVAAIMAFAAVMTVSAQSDLPDWRLPVTGLTAVAGDDPGAMVITWDAHTQTTKTLLNYRVAWTPDGESFKSADRTNWNVYTTSNQHTVTGLDAGATYQVKVRTRYEGNQGSRWTDVVTGQSAVTTNTPATGQPTIAGTVETGETLTAATSSISDDNGLANAAFAYQWIHTATDSEAYIPAATASSYLLSSDDLGHSIKVRVTFTDDDGYTERLTSSATALVVMPANVAATGQPTITGTAEVNETLTAATSAISDDNGLTNAVFSHQWIRSANGSDTAITDATGSTYVITNADVDSTIKVRVNFTDDDRYSETLISNATTSVPVPAPVIIPPEAPQIAQAAGDAQVLNTWPLIPTGLGAGDSFRLLFLSSIKRNPQPTAISTYNTWIQERAEAGHDDIQDYSDGFRVVGCTAADDAQDNTATTYTTANKGVPIYWLNGNKVADEYEAFYDGGWDDEANDKNELGTNGPDTSQSVNYPATGCDDNGTERTVTVSGATQSRGLGSGHGVTVARPNSYAFQAGPLSSNSETLTGNNHPFYGLSAVFTIVAASTDATLSALAIEGATGGESITLTPAFDEDTFTYTAAVAHGIDEVTLTAATTHSGAMVAITDDDDANTKNEADLDLNVGANTLTVTVTAEDTSVTATYTITVTRERDPTEPVSLPVIWSLIPSGLSDGDQFRLLFLSGTRRDGSSSVITDYNTFVRTRAAAGHPDIQAYSDGFMAVGCTEAVAAHDNTGTTYTSTDKGVPIYWLDGNKVAEDYEDFYDGSWDDETNDKNEFGNDAHNTSVDANYPLTGCSDDGTEKISGSDSSALGNGGDVTVARPDSSGSGNGPLSSGQKIDETYTRPMYALSQVFTVTAPTDCPTHATWCTAMRVRNTTTTAPLAKYEFSGYNISGPNGALGSTTFSHESTDYTITRLEQTTFTTLPANTISLRNFYLKAEPALPAGTILTLGDRSFTVGDESENPTTGQEEWDTIDNPLNWTNRQEITVSLTLLPDATLSNIAIEGTSGGQTVVLSPAFDDHTLTYTARVGNGIDEVTLTATKSDSNATVVIANDDHASTPDTADLDLRVGSNTLAITVTAMDTTTTNTLTYTITVTRAESGSEMLVPGDWNLIPSDLSAGDSFRLLFLSSTRHDASSASIDTYNTFVQGRAANGHTDIQAYSDGFTVVGCTAAVDARDNTGTTFTNANKGIPIYWLNGNKVADEYEDFYDGSWDDEANDKNQSGNNGPDTSDNEYYPLTGCDHNGTENFISSQSHALASSAGVTVARPNSSDTGHGPLSSGFQLTATNSRPMYGLSAVFTIVQLSTDATLSDLVMEGATDGDSFNLSPRFDQDTFTYTASVANRFDAVTLTATTNHGSTTVVITNDDNASTPDTADLHLDVGANTLTVTVTAQDPSTTLTYIITVTRAATAAADATLSDLAIEGTTGGQAVVLNPAFDEDTFTYTASVANRFDTVKLTATKKNSGATVVITGDNDTNTKNEAYLDLSVSTNTLTITVTAEDSSSTKTYTVSVTRTATPPAPTDCPTLNNWCTTMGVGYLTGTSTGVTNEFWGYQSYAIYGDLLSTTFSYDGTTYTVSELYRLKQSTINTITDDTLALTVSPELPDSTVLQLGSRTFTVGTASQGVSTGHERWEMGGNPLSWTDGQHVTASLKLPGSATLSDLAIEGATGGQALVLSPAFDEDTFTYTAAVANRFDTVKLTATKKNSGATVVITGDNDTNTKNEAYLDLSVGTNTLTITVTAENNTTKTYTVSVTRTATPPAPTDCPTLNNWCTTMGVGYLTGTSTGVTNEFWGYQSYAIYGDLLSTTFSYDGTTYTVSELYRLKQSTINTITDDTLALTVSPELPDSTVLQLGSRTFTVDATSQGVSTGHERWEMGGNPLSWTDGQHVTANLKLPGSAIEPNAPTNLMATVESASQIDLEWYAPTNNGGTAITGYKIQHSPNGSSDWTNLVTNTGTDETEYSDTGLNPSTTRYYRVFAINSIGTSAASNIANATTTPISPPGRVSGVNITPGYSSLSVRWTAVSDATGYELQWKSGGQTYDTSRQALISSGSTTNYLISNLNNGTQYTIQVIATKTGASNGPPSVEKTGTPVTIPPSVSFGPGSFTASENGATARVTVELSVPADVTIPLRVQHRAGATSADYSGVPRRLIFEAGQTIRSFTVTAVDDSDNDDGEKIRIQFDNLPAGFEAGNRSAITVKLKDNDEGNSLPLFDPANELRYLVENTAANQNVGLPITATDADGDSLTYTFSGPDMDRFTFVPATAQLRTKSGQIYDYETHELFVIRVTADDGNGGTKTATVVIYVRDMAEPPEAPTSLTLVQAYPTSMLLSWTPPDNTGRPAITGYDLQFKKSNESAWTAGLKGITTTSDSITGLDPSTSYNVQVRANNDEGNGTWSSTLSRSTPSSSPGISITKTNLTITEGDQTGQIYLIVLGSLPTADVHVYISGYDETTVAPHSRSKTFNTGNWNVPRQVRLRTSEDTDTTDETVTITHRVESDDTDYEGITVPDMTVTVIDNDTPQVTGVSTQPGDRQLTVNWTAADKATGYKVQWKAPGDNYNTNARMATITSGSTTTYTIPNLTNGTEYTVLVTATWTDHSDGPRSDEATGTPTATP